MCIRDSQNLVPSAFVNVIRAVTTLALVFVFGVCAYAGVHREPGGKPIAGRVFVLQSLVGAALQLAAVYPLTVQDSDIASQAGMDAACMATPWLFVVGFAVSYAPVLARIWKFHAIFHNDKLKAIRRSDALDSIAFQSLLFAPVLCILVAWQATDPMTWRRDATVVDANTGFVLESVGVCASDHVARYVVPIVVVCFLAIVSGLALAFRNRAEAAALLLSLIHI